MGYTGGMTTAILVVLTAVAAAAPSPAEVRTALAEFNAAAVFPLPGLSDKQLQRLLAGEVLKIIDRPGGEDTPRRGVGLLWTPASRDQMWLACQDLHFTQNDSVTELRLSLEPPDKALWYGIVDLPRPFSDRHWVVEVWNNHAMAQKTADRAWEHPWRSAPGALDRAQAAVEAGKVRGVDAERFGDAVHMPANQGAWVAVSLPDGSSVFGYHNASVLGGNIPESLMVRYVASTLERTLKDIEKRAQQTIPGHYVAGHAPVVGGAGTAVPPQGGG